MGEKGCANADLFAFIPVPRGQRVSTSKSRLGTIVFITVFFSYMFYTLTQFLTSNTPRINQYFVPLDDYAIYEAPEMAFAFVTGDNLNQSFYNESYFYYSFEQVSIDEDPDKGRNYTNLPLVTC